MKVSNPLKYKFRKLPESNRYYIDTPLGRLDAFESSPVDSPDTKYMIIKSSPGTNIPELLKYFNEKDIRLKRYIVLPQSKFEIIK